MIAATARKHGSKAVGSADHTKYDSDELSNRPSKDQLNGTTFAHFKFRFLEQVALDQSSHALGPRLAIAIVTKYLNKDNGTAWPSIPTLAKLLSKSENSIRDAVRWLENRGHMAVAKSSGGKKNTNTFIPLVDGQPFKKLKGYAAPNPSENDGEILQNSDAKPFSKLNPNSYEVTTGDEPGGALGARRRGSLPNEGSRDAPLRGAPAANYRIGSEVSITGFGTGVIRRFGRNDLAPVVKIQMDDERFLLVPLLQDGRFASKHGIWEDQLSFNRASKLVWD